MTMLELLQPSKFSEWKHRAIFGQAVPTLSFVVLATITFSCSLHLCAAQQQTDQTPVTRAAGDDWMRWTASDCDSILNGSFLGRSRWTFAPSKLLEIQLRSALPVRQALLRRSQLDSNYDTMSAEQRRAFDEKNPSEIADSESGPILLYIEQIGGETCILEPPPLYNCREQVYRSPAPAREVALQLADGTLVMPIKTEALEDDTGKSRFIYSFPRVISGRPVITPGDTGLNFVFGRELQGGGHIRPLQNAKRFRVASGPRISLTSVSFPTMELIYNGKLEY